jgi:hypothetical protein
MPFKNFMQSIGNAIGQSMGQEARERQPDVVRAEEKPAHERSGYRRDRYGEPGNRSARHDRRERTYVVVRDAMARAGVLSANYKFKVLSLDAEGQRFVVMMDVAREYAGDTERMIMVETTITQSAKVRLDLQIVAVYWRINPQMSAMGMASRNQRDRQAAPAATVWQNEIPVKGRRMADRPVARLQDEQVSSAHSTGSRVETPAPQRTETTLEDARLAAAKTQEPDFAPTRPASHQDLSNTQYGDLV